MQIEFFQCKCSALRGAHVFRKRVCLVNKQVHVLRFDSAAQLVSALFLAQFPSSKCAAQ